ncbi:MAG: alkaline phosphatase [Rubrobacteraceae bacterium]
MLVGFGLSVALAVLASLGTLTGASPAQENGGARNVILFIGDGLGAAQRDAIQLATVGPYGRLAMDDLPYRGMVSTNPVDSETSVTDSAAAATAMAAGVKTTNGLVGMDEEGNPVPTILEQAGAAGKSTGLVSTGEVTDASPAAFAAHVEDREEQTEIARQYVEESRPDVLLGGGESYWYPEGVPGAFPDNDEEAASQGDQGNLVEAAQESGYEYVTNAEELAAASGRQLLGLFANGAMFAAGPEGEGVYDPSVPLTDMTGKAIETLSQNPEGFFLMVEEEAIDDMGHANNGELQIKSGRALDRAVARAVDFAEANPDTLVVTVGDHECCGLNVEQLDRKEYPGENASLSTEDGPFDVAGTDYQFIMNWSTTRHTGVDVPLTAIGPGGNQLTGNYENTRIYEVMAGSLGVADLEPLSGTGGSPAIAGATSSGFPIPVIPALVGGAGVAAGVVAGLLVLRVRVLRGP